MNRHIPIKIPFYGGIRFIKSKCDRYPGPFSSDRYAQCGVRRDEFGRYILGPLWRTGSPWTGTYGVYQMSNRFDLKPMLYR